MKRTLLIVTLGLIASLGLFTACKKAAPAAEAKTYSSTGMVVGFRSEGKVVILKHQKIEGYMEAMTMGFELRDPALGKGLKKGDKVAFSLEENAGGVLVTVLTKQ
jgi:Cu/Ag efflux protein CusF